MCPLYGIDLGRLVLRRTGAAVGSGAFGKWLPAEEEVRLWSCDACSGVFDDTHLGLGCSRVWGRRCIHPLGRLVGQVHFCHESRQGLILPPRKGRRVKAVSAGGKFDLRGARTGLRCNDNFLGVQQAWRHGGYAALTAPESSDGTSDDARGRLPYVAGLGWY